MKKYGLYALFVSLIVLAYALGRLHEQEKSIKDYQAACVLSDVCHYMVDNIGVDAEEIYFDTIDNLDCDSTLRITREEIQRYNWNY
jgi:hypothetical protein